MTGYPKWREALDRLSQTWKGLTSEEWIEKYDGLVAQAVGNGRMQHNIVYWADKDAGRIKNRLMYAKHSNQRAEDARDARKRMKSDPAKLNSYRIYCRDKARKRLKTDINFLMRKKLRTRISMAVKHYDKSAGTEALTGCSFTFLRKHLESQWKPGMSWSNYGRGGWHIDHKIPCITFDLSQPSQQFECFHYSNLRPLWEWENLSKGAQLLYVERIAA